MRKFAGWEWTLAHFVMVYRTEGCSPKFIAPTPCIEAMKRRGLLAVAKQRKFAPQARGYKYSYAILNEDGLRLAKKLYEEYYDI